LDLEWMCKRKLILVAILLCMYQAVQGAGDPVAGKEKAVLCMQCHDKDDNSADSNIPKLSGQLASYIVLAIIEFQKGIRIDPLMDGISHVVENTQDLENIAAYFVAQPTMQGNGRTSKLKSEGEALFTTERCNYCHGDGGKRYAPFAGSPPVIGGQRKAYLIKALQDIKEGKRPGDVYGLMVESLGKLSDKQIDAITEYLSGL